MTTAVPTLRDLLANYLEQAAQQPALPVSDVEPHQAEVFTWAEPQTYWPQAVRAGQLLLPTVSWQTEKRPVADWARKVRDHGPQRVVTFCLGHVPQLLADVTPLLTQGRSALQAPQARADAGPAPETAPRGATVAEQLVRAACLRMGGHFKAAEETLSALTAAAGTDLALLLTNERAALAWQRGDVVGASKLWSAHAELPVFAFNLGLAALCQGDVNAATTHLRKAAAALPDSDPWHHLAQVYLTLC